MKYLSYVLPIILLSACHARWRHLDREAYMRLPDMALLLPDSSNVFHTSQLLPDRPNILVYFDPDCEHCQFMTTNLLAHRQGLGDADILFISQAPLKDIQKYIQRFHLDSDKHIRVAKDYQYEVFNTYKINSVPDIIVYNRKRELTRLYKGDIDISRVIRAVHS